MNKKVVLSACAFMLAIGGAVASNLVILGHSKIADVPEQSLICEPRENCDESGPVLCTNSEEYRYPVAGQPDKVYPAGTVQLFQLTAPNTCPIALFRAE